MSLKSETVQQWKIYFFFSVLGKAAEAHLDPLLSVDLHTVCA